MQMNPSCAAEILVGYMGGDDTFPCFGGQVCVVVSEMEFCVVGSG